MRKIPALIFCLHLLSWQACVTGSANSQRPSVAAEDQNLPELSHEPLPPAVALTKDYFRRSYPHLSDEQFSQKWKNAQASGLMFLRSFVNTWYDELGKINRLGPIGACLGDPHPENFGYIWFGASDFKFVYNDIDDIGACPVIFDALRYFTALRLTVKDPRIETETRRAYMRYLNGDPLPHRLSLSQKPDFQAVAAKVLSKTVRDLKLKLNATTLAVNKTEKAELFRVLQKALPGSQQLALLDAAKVVVSAGGSAGLQRYWLLLQTPDRGQQVVEFKQLTQPASQRGSWTETMHLDRESILADIWSGEMPNYYGFGEFQEKFFLIRSRIKGDLDAEGLSAEQMLDFYREQVWLMAQLHKKTLEGTGLFEEWLDRQSEFLAKRYSEALLAAKGT